MGSSNRCWTSQHKSTIQQSTQILTRFCPWFDAKLRFLIFCK